MNKIQVGSCHISTLSQSERRIGGGNGRNSQKQRRDDHFSFIASPDRLYRRCEIFGYFWP
jgi:hypothetical protein